MRFFRITLVLIEAFILVLVVRALAASGYQHLRYPGVKDTVELVGIDVSSKSRFTSCKPHEYKSEQ